MILRQSRDLLAYYRLHDFFYNVQKCDRSISFRRDVIVFSRLFQRDCVDCLQSYEMINVRYADLKQRD
jgi:hypothetical protein